MAQSILVTGASRGLGLEFVRRFQSRGDAVFGSVRREADAVRLPAGATPLILDVESADSIAEFARLIADRSFDALINNAGVGEGVFYDGREGPRLDGLDFDAMVRQFSINSLGPLRVLRAALPALRRGRRRLVVNISSELGSIEQNTTGGWTGYRASKAALNMLTRCMAAELGGDGFTCVAMHPGWVRTDMGGSEAPLSPAESVAGMVAVIDTLTARDNGTFRRYDGAKIPW
jgi:NAD(P)-dependent dehydrogenase (short-subunit alcohol dehydrogenase family)